MATVEMARSRSRRDRSDFERFFRVEYPRLLGAAYLLTGSREEAEDLAQEALARVCERWSRVKTMASPGGYAFRVATNLNRRRLKRLAVSARRVFAPPPGGFQATEPSDLVLAIRGLSKPLREALVLVEWYGFNSTEAAQMLGVRPSSVRARIRRARLTLGQEFEDDE